MVLVYRKLSHSLEEVKAEKESCATSAELVGSSNMQAALCKLETENAELRSRLEEMIYENQRLTGIIISRTRSSASLQKLHGRKTAHRGTIRSGRVDTAGWGTLLLRSLGELDKQKSCKDVGWWGSVHMKSDKPITTHDYLGHGKKDVQLIPQGQTSRSPSAHYPRTDLQISLSSLLEDRPPDLQISRLPDLTVAMKEKVDQMSQPHLIFIASMSTHGVEIDQFYIELAGGFKKGRVHGLWSQACAIYPEGTRPHQRGANGVECPVQPEKE
ncbi:hypothetical protein F511_34905 [Dorcoceras hygrometricum]|uniref:Uncharacterized protein n=1 Tax=Dorcoceras hygrometricum TaxID=472368 RepID=A0A2Z7BTB2_9LAMI|nr:hypothetical protein F511_34905 [Dorcoceras hygrometricum]